MTYVEFLEMLNVHAEEKLARFHEPLINSKSQKILGIRTPIMRKIAKANTKNIDELLTYPDEYHEVTMIKLLSISYLPYDQFVAYINRAVSLISNWAHCDCFKADCIKSNREEFLPYIKKYFETGKEFFQRYALVTLLNYYIEDRYFDIIKEFLKRTKTEFYYVHMAVAWLTAEILTKEYEFGVLLLKAKILDSKTHNKAIQKARESYRLTNEKKEFLKTLKIKK